MTFTDLKNWFSDSIQSKYSEREAANILKELLTHFDDQQRNWTAIIGEENLLAVIQSKINLSILDRILSDEPLAYIIGHTYFYDLPFKVNQHVLIPRPETEELVNWILEENFEKANVLDIGTGSGCIAIALTNNRTNWTVEAIDISKDALMLAKSNAILNHVEVNFKNLDVLNEDLSIQYDIIVSNPPYISLEEESVMSRTTLKHEPSIALFTQNNDPLQFYKRIGALAKHSLAKNGSLYFELNEFFANETKAMLKNLGYHVELKTDLQGKARMAKCQLF